MSEDTQNSKTDEQKTADKIFDGPSGAQGPSGAGESGAAASGAAESGAAESGAAESGAKESGATGPDGATGPSGPPEKYELTLPEGSLLTAEAIERTATFAKEQGLSNKAAQAVLDRESKALSSYAESQKESWEKETVAWLETAKTDKETGGEEFGKNAELAKRVITRYGTKEFASGLSATGFGNHPELFRFVLRIGKAMGEDQLVLPGSQTPAETKDMADLFYGGSEKKE